MWQKKKSGKKSQVKQVKRMKGSKAKVEINT